MTNAAPPMPWTFGGLSRYQGYRWATWRENGVLMAQLRCERDPLDISATPWRWDGGRWLPAHDAVVPETVT